MYGNNPGRDVCAVNALLPGSFCQCNVLYLLQPSHQQLPCSSGAAPCDAGCAVLQRGPPARKTWSPRSGRARCGIATASCWATAGRPTSIATPPASGEGLRCRQLRWHHTSVVSGISAQVDSNARRRCSLQLQPRRQPLLVTTPCHQAAAPGAMRSDTIHFRSLNPRKAPEKPSCAG